MYLVIKGICAFNQEKQTNKLKETLWYPLEAGLVNDSQLKTLISINLEIVDSYLWIESKLIENARWKLEHGTECCESWVFLYVLKYSLCYWTEVTQPECESIK